MEKLLGTQNIFTTAGIYEYEKGNSASGIDLPKALGLNEGDMQDKATSIFLPFKSAASQKVFGLDTICHFYTERR